MPACQPPEAQSTRRYSPRSEHPHRSQILRTETQPPIRRLILTVKRRSKNPKGVICPQQASVAALLVDRGEEFGGHTATGPLRFGDPFLVRFLQAALWSADGEINDVL
jgi:hypothetical protein